MGTLVPETFLSTSRTHHSNSTFATESLFDLCKRRICKRILVPGRNTAGYGPCFGFFFANFFFTTAFLPPFVLTILVVLSLPNPMSRIEIVKILGEYINAKCAPAPDLRVLEYENSIFKVSMKTRLQTWCRVLYTLARSQYLHSNCL